MRYVLLLRGINVGGKNKVSMADLKKHLTEAGFENTDSYINSGNLFFDSQEELGIIVQQLKELFQKYYPFVKYYCLLNKHQYQEDFEQLPIWWQENFARKDVLFYTKDNQDELAKSVISQMNLEDEVVYFGRYAIFWGKRTQSLYLKTAYHKELIKTPLYKEVTVRNGNTYNKIAQYLL